MGAPVYVCGKDVAANTVYVGPESSLYVDSLLAEDMNWISISKLEGPMRVKAKTRYRQTEQWATAYPGGGVRTPVGVRCSPAGGDCWSGGGLIRR